MKTFIKDSKKCPARSKAGECRANASVKCCMKNCVAEYWKEAPVKVPVKNREMGVQGPTNKKPAKKVINIVTIKGIKYRTVNTRKHQGSTAI